MIKDLSELAQNLGISKDTLGRWINQGKIPVLRKGGLCEFDLTILQKWASSRKIGFNIGILKDSNHSDEKADRRCFLSEAIRIGGIFYDVDADSAESAIRRIADFAPLSGPEVRDILVSSLLEREKIRTTGVGMGIAIPHPQRPMPELFPHSFMTVCFLKKNVDFFSADGRLVSVVFLLVASSQREHLQLLSRLSFCLKNRDFMDLVQSRPDAEIFISSLNSIELKLNKQK